MKHYLHLMRLHKPIGILLLLWPTLWALWLASHGKPDGKVFFIFFFGVIVMRSAGCVINDIADRRIDKFVERTKDRPLTSGKVSTQAALLLFLLLITFAFLLVLCLNQLTIQLAFIGAALAIIYPFLKRFTQLPQLGLGLAFAWGVPMAFAAQNHAIPLIAWELFFAAVVWPIMYDTIYAMVDREDDKKIGVKSTAILFESHDRNIIAGLQVLFLVTMIKIGYAFALNYYYFISLVFVTALFVYQQRLLYVRERGAYFAAFLNNHWVGMIIFIGILLGQLK